MLSNLRNHDHLGIGSEIESTECDILLDCGPPKALSAHQFQEVPIPARRREDADRVIMSA